MTKNGISNLRFKKQKNILLLGAASLLGFVGTSAFPTMPAYAQKGVVLQPQTGWSIKNVSNADSRSSYCALARRFRGDLILSIAKNYANESSVALDFSNQSFSLDQGFDIILDAGAGQIREFNVYPVSRKAFVVRLGRDEQFFDALSRTGHLRVEVRGRNYNFNLADIEQGRTKLARCLEQNGRFDSAEDMSEPVDSESLSQLTQRLDQLEQENQNLRQDLDVVQEGVSSTGIAIPVQAPPAMPLDILPERSVAVLDVAPPPKPALDERDYQRQVSAQNRQIDQLLDRESGTVAGTEARRIQDKVVVSAKDGRDETLTLREQELFQPNKQRIENLATLESLRAENQNLRAKLQANPNASLELRAMRNLADEMSKENIQLTNQLSQMHTLRDQHVQEIRALTQDYAALELKLGNVNALEDKVAALETENKIQQSSLQLIKADLQKAVAERDDLQARFSTYDSDAREKIVLLEQELGEKKTRISELNTMLTNNVGEETRLGQAVQILRQENSALKEALETERVISNRSSEKIAVLSAQLNDVSAKNEQLQENSITYEAELRSKIATLESDISLKEARLATLNDKVSTSSNEETKFGQTIEALREENQTLKTALAKEEALAQSAGEKAAALSNQVDDIRAQNERLQSLFTAYETDLKVRVASLESDLNEKRAQLSDLNETLTDNVSDETKFGRAIQSLRQENENLKTALLDEKAFSERTEDKVDTLSRRLNEIRAQNQQLQSQIASARSQTGSASRSVVSSAGGRAANAAAGVASSASGAAINAARSLQSAGSDAISSVARTASESSDEVEASSAVYDALGALPEQEVRSLNAVPQKVARQQEAASDTIEIAQNLNDVQKQDVEIRRKLDERDLVGTATADRASIGEQALQAVPDRPPSQPQTEAYLRRGTRQIVEIGVAENKSKDNPSSVDENISEVFEAPKDRAAGDLPSAPTPQSPASPRQFIAPLDEVTSDAAIIQAKAENAYDQTNQASSQGAVYTPRIAVSDILRDAEIALRDNVEKVERFSSEDRVAYQWRSSNDLFGSSHQIPLQSTSDFESLVSDYLTDTQSRCTGDFAVVPSNTVEQGNVRVDSYEIACIGADIDSSASLVFFNTGGAFTVIAHEGESAKMGMAMDIRDRLARSLVDDRDS